MARDACSQPRVLSVKILPATSKQTVVFRQGKGLESKQYVKRTNNKNSKTFKIKTNDHFYIIFSIVYAYKSTNKSKLIKNGPSLLKKICVLFFPFDSGSHGISKKGGNPHIFHRGSPRKRFLLPFDMNEFSKVKFIIELVQPAPGWFSFPAVDGAQPVKIYNILKHIAKTKFLKSLHLVDFRIFVIYHYFHKPVKIFTVQTHFFNISLWQLMPFTILNIKKINDVIVFFKIVTWPFDGFLHEII